MEPIIVILIITTAAILAIVTLHVVVRAILDYRTDQQRQRDLHIGMIRARFERGKDGHDGAS